MTNFLNHVTSEFVPRAAFIPEVLQNKKSGYGMIKSQLHLFLKKVLTIARKRL